MGIIQISDVPKVKSILQSVAADFKPMTLQLEKIRKLTTANGKDIAFVDVAPNEEVTKLFVKIKELLAPYLSYDVDVSIFYTPPKVNPISKTWVEHYYDNNQAEDFRGHITLGEGKTKQQINQPMEIQVSQLAVCHLGNCCTCREILAVMRLV